MAKPQGENSRRALIEAGIRLFSSNPEASFKALAQAAGVGRATLYRHFESREQLIEAIALESLEQIKSLTQPLDLEQQPAADGLLNVIRVLIPVGEHYNFLITLWHEIAAITTVMKAYDDQLRMISRLVERAQQEGAINCNMSSEWVTSLIDALLYIGWIQVASGKMTVEQAATHACDSFLHGVTPANNGRGCAMVH